MSVPLCPLSPLATRLDIADAGRDRALPESVALDVVVADMVSCELRSAARCAELSISSERNVEKTDAHISASHYEPLTL